MKQLFYLLLGLCFLLGFNSCSDDDEDASVLIGEWEQTELPVIEIRSNKEEIHELIKKEILRCWYTSNFEFREDKVFQHYTYNDSGTRLSYSLGDYYRKNNKLYAKFPAGMSHFGISTFFLDMKDENKNELEVSFNAMNYFNSPDQLRIIGIEDPTGIIINSVSIKYTFVRK